MKLYRRRLLNGTGSTPTPNPPTTTYTVRVQANPSTAGNVEVKSGTQTSSTQLVLNSGASYSLSTSAKNTSYQFANWSNNIDSTIKTTQNLTNLSLTQDITWTANYNTVTTNPILTVKKRPDDAKGSVHIGSPSNSVTESGFTQGSSVTIYAQNESPQYVIQWEHDGGVLPVTLQANSPFVAYLGITMPSSSTTYTAYISNLIAEHLMLNISLCKTYITSSSIREKVYLFKFRYVLYDSSEAVKRLAYLNGANSGTWDPSRAEDPTLYLPKSVSKTNGTYYAVSGGNAGTNTTTTGAWYLTESDVMTQQQITLPPLFVPNNAGNSEYSYDLLYNKITVAWYYGNGVEHAEDDFYNQAHVTSNVPLSFYYNTSFAIDGITPSKTFTTPTHIDNIILRLNGSSLRQDFLDLFPDYTRGEIM